MRKLHLVGLTTDRDGLIFTARKGSKSGGFIVPLDDKVRTAIAGAAGVFDDGGAGGASTMDDVGVVPKRLRSESALTPREMQARLRAGRSIDEVASEAGVDTEWVARFAVPILAEQAQVVELARNLVYAKPRLGESSQALGTSVVQNLSDRSVFLPDDVANAGWSAFQLHDSVWMVRFRYRSRNRDQEAQWEIDVPTGRLRARNRHASDLGYVGPDRWRSVVESDEMDPDDAAPAPAPAVAPTPRSARAAVKVAPSGKRAAAIRANAPRRRPAAGAPPAAKGAKSRPAPMKTRAAAASKAKTTPAAAKQTRASRTAPAAKAPARPRVAKAKAARVTPAGRTGGPAKAGTAKRPPTLARTAVASRSVKAAPAGTRSSPRTASAKTPAKRAAKAVPAPEAGPTAGSGSVRLAVAQVSTARVAASMALADREPWAAAVRRPPRPAPQPAGAAGRQTAARPTPRAETAARRPVPRAEPDRPGSETDPASDQDAPRRNAFVPRPLPAPGGEPAAPRVRKVTVPRPPPRPQDGPAPVTLPAPRRAAPAQEGLPVERAKRRRLRSR